MSLHTGIVLLLTTAIVAVCALVVAWMGLDGSMAAGIAGGLVLGAGLTLMGGRSLKRALGHGSKSALMTHMFGGFLFRVILLVAGFALLVATGWASPVGFAVAFLAGVMIALARQVVVFAGAGETAPAA